MADKKPKDGIQETEVVNTDVAEALNPVVNPDLPAGITEDVVEKNDHPDEAVRDRIEHEEKVVYELDEDGNKVSWHKEPADGSTPKEQNDVLTAEQAQATEDKEDK